MIFAPLDRAIFEALVPTVWSLKPQICLKEILENLIFFNSVGYSEIQCKKVTFDDLKIEGKVFFFQNPKETISGFFVFIIFFIRSFSKIDLDAILYLLTPIFSNHSTFSSSKTEAINSIFFFGTPQTRFQFVQN